MIVWIDMRVACIYYMTLHNDITCILDVLDQNELIIRTSFLGTWKTPKMFECSPIQIEKYGTSSGASRIRRCGSLKNDMNDRA